MNAWGGGLPNFQGDARSNARPDTVRDHRCRHESARRAVTNQNITGVRWEQFEAQFALANSDPHDEAGVVVFLRRSSGLSVTSET